MNRSFLLLFVLLFPFIGYADEIKIKELFLVDGKKYESVTVRKIEPDGIRIMHAGGMAKIPYEKLTEELQKELGGFDPEKANQYRDKDAKSQKKAAEVAYKKHKQRKKAINDKKLVASAKTLQFVVFSAAVEGGVLAHNTITKYTPVRSSGSASIGGGGGVSGGNSYQAKGRTLYFIKGLNESLVDGQWITIKATPEGTYEYQTTTGTKATVSAYRFVKLIKKGK